LLLLVAHLVQDDRPNSRLAPRRSLSLKIPALSSGDPGTVLIHNLSEHGLRVETGAGLSVEEIIRVVLPEAGSVDARVVWTDGCFAGCRFLSPVPKTAVSAALLRSPAANVPESVELPPISPFVGIDQRLEIDRIEADYEARKDSEAALLFALLIALLVAVLFIVALVRLTLGG